MSPPRSPTPSSSRTRSGRSARYGMGGSRGPSCRVPANQRAALPGALRARLTAMQVFLSYSHQDQPIADVVRQSLVDCGVAVSSVQETPVGESIAETVASRINAADALVVLLGTETIHRQWSMLEIGGGLASQKPVIPVR